MEGSRMDSIATGLAGIVVLALPLLLWLRLKARTKYEQEIAEVKKLAEERSQLLDELHSRLDSLGEQDSQKEPIASEEATSNALRLLEWQMAHQSAAGRDVASERYFAALRILDPEALDPEAFRLEVMRLHNERAYWIHCLQLEEAQTGPGWLKEARLHEPVRAKDLRRKRDSRRVIRKPLQGPTLQASYGV